MKKFSGYDEAKKNADYSVNEKLPAGAYVAEILATRYEEGKAGASDQIVVQFDIAEGDYKNFYKKQYEASTVEGKKWKGVARVWVPADDGSERDEWTKNSFAKWPNSIEKSNEGYSWDWDETKWKGKKVGLVFRETGTVINGKEVVYTEVAFPIEAQKVRDGKAPEAKFKARNGYTGNGGTNNSVSTSSDDDWRNVPAGVDEEVPF